MKRKPNIITFRGFWEHLWHMPELKIIVPGFVLLGLSLLLPRFGLPDGWAMLIQLVLLPLAGWPVFKNGYISLVIEHKLNINFLMSLAAIGAVVIGETHEALIMLALFTVSEALEEYTSDTARAVLSEFADLAPKKATLFDAGEERVVSVESLKVNDLIIVKPGERFSMDGVVESGMSEVNQAPITGESRMVTKTVGDEVLSSTINGQGILKVRVNRLVEDNTIQRIIALVTEAQANKANQEKFIDRFAAVYTPIVVAVGVLVVAVPPLFLGQSLWNTAGGYGWLHRGLSLLMVGCPCALVISTPITIISALTRAAQEGVVFKGGVFLEGLGRVKTMAFDKTGTLTQGHPSIKKVKAVDCREVEPEERCEPCDDLIALASALEHHSSHPLGQAVLAEAVSRGVAERYAAAEQAQNLDGKGQRGYVNGKLATVGSLAHFREAHADHLPNKVITQTLEAEKAGQTTMLVCDGEVVRGFMGVEDLVRPEAQQVLNELHDLSIDTVMLTGDNEGVAARVGQSLGLKEYRAGLLPAEKLDALDDLKARDGSVAMVGDGINDSPAIARADVGIAMGGAGNAQVLETADVVLMNDDLSRLPFAVKLARFANLLIRQNVTVSLGLKFLVAILAIMGLTPLWVAILADVGISLAVTLNGLRGMRFAAN